MIKSEFTVVLECHHVEAETPQEAVRAVIKELFDEAKLAKVLTCFLVGTLKDYYEGHSDQLVVKGREGGLGDPIEIEAVSHEQAMAIWRSRKNPS